MTPTSAAHRLCTSLARSARELAVAATLLTTGCSMESKFASAKPTVHVAVARDGTTTLEGKAVAPDALVAEANARADAHFVVDAERDVSFQVLVGTLERLRAGGASDIALGAVLPSAPPPPPSAAPSPAPSLP